MCEHKCIAEVRIGIRNWGPPAENLVIMLRDNYCVQMLGSRSSGERDGVLERV